MSRLSRLAPIPAIAALVLATLAIGPAAQAKDKKPVDPDKRVCRREVPTGSLMPKSTCRTVAEWARYDADEAASAHASLDRARQNGVGATGQ